MGTIPVPDPTATISVWSAALLNPVPYGPITETNGFSPVLINRQSCDVHASWPSTFDPDITSMKKSMVSSLGALAMEYGCQWWSIPLMLRNTYCPGEKRNVLGRWRRRVITFLPSVSSVPIALDSTTLHSRPFITACIRSVKYHINDAVNHLKFCDRTCPFRNASSRVWAMANANITNTRWCTT